jgi:hypothetical protein
LPYPSYPLPIRGHELAWDRGDFEYPSISDQEVIEMRKVYVAVAALVVAIAVALGTYTVTRSAALGPTSTKVQNVNSVVSQGNQRLNATEAALNRVLAQRPPAMNGGRVVYMPPRPVVVNVSGLTSAVVYTPQAPHFDDEGGQGD